MSPRHFLSSADISPQEQASLIARARQLKEDHGSAAAALQGMTVALLFEKPSTRSRASLEVAITRLGGHALALRGDELQLGRGETLRDTARALSCYVDALVVRTFGQERLVALAEGSLVPVVNALSDDEHPCQALADMMTVLERFPDPAPVVFAYLGDGNNVCHSLMLAASNAGLAELRVACPEGYEPDERVVKKARSAGLEVSVTSDPSQACSGAHVLYTDVWASMGQEVEREARLQAFQGFQLSEERLAEAGPSAIVMHCLPAHRGEEISAGVMDGEASVVWEQAANRLHVQEALLEWLLR